LRHRTTGQCGKELTRGTQKGATLGVKPGPKTTGKRRKETKKALVRRGELREMSGVTLATAKKKKKKKRITRDDGGRCLKGKKRSARAEIEEGGNIR